MVAKRTSMLRLYIFCISCYWTLFVIIDRLDYYELPCIIRQYLILWIVIDYSRLFWPGCDLRLRPKTAVQGRCSTFPWTIILKCWSAACLSDYFFYHNRKPSRMLLWLCHVALYGRRSIFSSVSYHITDIISQITCSVSAIMLFLHHFIGVMTYSCAMFYFMLDAKLLLQPETLLSSKHWFRTLSAVLYYISQEHDAATIVTLQSECKGTYLTQNTIRRQWLPWPLVFYSVSQSVTNSFTHSH